MEFLKDTLIILISQVSFLENYIKIRLCYSNYL